MIYHLIQTTHLKRFLAVIDFFIFVLFCYFLFDYKTTSNNKPNEALFISIHHKATAKNYAFSLPFTKYVVKHRNCTVLDWIIHAHSFLDTAIISFFINLRVTAELLINSFFFSLNIKFMQPVFWQAEKCWGNWIKIADYANFLADAVNEKIYVVLENNNHIIKSIEFFQGLYSVTASKMQCWNWNYFVNFLMEQRKLKRNLWKWVQISSSNHKCNMSLDSSE